MGKKTKKMFSFQEDELLIEVYLTSQLILNLVSFSQLRSVQTHLFY